MGMKCILSIDQGTTGSRAVLYDKDAKKIALSIKRAQHADDTKMLSAVREEQGPQTMADKLKDFKVNKD